MISLLTDEYFNLLLFPKPLCRGIIDIPKAVQILYDFNSLKFVKVWI